MKPYHYPVATIVVLCAFLVGRSFAGDKDTGPFKVFISRSGDTQRGIKVAGSVNDLAWFPGISEDVNNIVGIGYEIVHVTFTSDRAVILARKK